MTANPADVPSARTMRAISRSEASELAYYGAKVLHHKTIIPVQSAGIPVRILNTMNPTGEGTRITPEGHPSPTGVKAITSIRNVSLVSVAAAACRASPASRRGPSARSRPSAQAC
jgi:aspartate kinase